MIKVKLGWEWARLNVYKNRVINAFVCTLDLKGLGIEFYRGDSSIIIYLELAVGTLMMRFGK
jgi:hypothetical protein